MGDNPLTPGENGSDEVVPRPRPETAPLRAVHVYGRGVRTALRNNATGLWLLDRDHKPDTAPW